MELFGVLLGFAAIGYGIYVLVLPFIIKGISKHLAEVDGKLQAIEAAVEELKRLPSAPKEKEAEDNEDVVLGEVKPSASDAGKDISPARTEDEETERRGEAECADEPEVSPGLHPQPSPWTYTSAEADKGG